MQPANDLVSASGDETAAETLQAHPSSMRESAPGNDGNLCKR